MSHRNSTVAVAFVVFLVSGAVESALNYGAHGKQWWSLSGHLDSVIVAAIIAGLFYLWRAQHSRYLHDIAVYSASRKIRIHRIRSLLTLMMFHADGNRLVKDDIRRLDEMLDEPIPDALMRFENKPEIKVFKANA